MARWTNRGRWPIAAALLAALIAGIAPVSAADSALDLAHRALKAGKPELVLRALNAALAGGALKGGDIAKAYYVRGLANAKAGNQAAAISDLNNALYLKGLSDTERKDAEAAKAAAYRTAGVSGAPAMAEAKPMASKPAVKVAEAPVPAAAAVEPAASAEPLPWKGQTQPAPKQVVAVDAPQPEPVAPAPAPAAVQQTSSDNPFSSMLGGLFGSDQPAPAAPVSQPIPDATKTVTVVQAETTSTTLPAPAWKTASAAAAAAKSGGIYLQVASLRTTREADALASKLTSEHAATLAGLEPSVSPVIIGNMGTFYAVRLGPVVTKAAGASLCGKLRKEGVDCYFATP